VVEGAACASGPQRHFGRGFHWFNGLRRIFGPGVRSSKPDHMRSSIFTSKPHL
jgi:hypothetical protein